MSAEPKRSAHPTALEKARNECATWANQAKAALPERDAIVDAVLLCAIACTNIVLYGLPGTAKSKLSRVFCSAIDGDIFDYLFTRFTTPAEINGPTDVQALKLGRQRRITTGKLPQAHVAFLDEGFKANSACLNSMLTAVNEHKFHDDGQVIDIPLRVAILASNEFPEDNDNLGAFDDRFPMRFEVTPLKNPDNFRKMLRRDLPPVTATIDVNNLQLLQDHAESLDVGEDVIDALWNLRTELEGKGIYASDRKMDVACGLMRARAALTGANKVTTAQLAILRHVLWLRPEQQHAVRELVDNHVATWLRDIRQAVDIVNQQEAAMAQAIKEKGSIAATNNKIGKIGQKLQELNRTVLKELEHNPDAKGEVEAIRKRINDILKKGRNAANLLLGGDPS